jgi:hypothetical protein
MIMNTAEYERLIALLKNCKAPAAVNCLERIQQKIPEYGLSSAIPANEAWDIYSRRKLWNESPSNPKRGCVSGYDQLMSLLPRGTDQKVKIHELKWTDTSILVFTDEEMAGYFGLLVIPQM